MSLEPAEADRRLDVREIDGEPFGDIMAAVQELEDDESLLLINSFEPEPLYDVLEQRGFTYEAANPEPDLWHVEVEHA
ncbi:DUF2249 domain-containing protein [Halomicrobium mukohataei]|uniref:DUF2249 domain-containing protein n=2 Tax=Halomicrobium mukohataei TaxID=57705 RepID=C7P4X9_HALMD|nr:DUF2249 domain-containing protein [Halomicrobium mukohataei]ACV49374.1 conserved hypothetical protein [Halomicrobium mukohataei DSM 12286]QCD67205.1 DUF2249 domain-containing protein [Halomicrobium mukohataei]